jgi:hypothetical protein
LDYFPGMTFKKMLAAVPRSPGGGCICGAEGPSIRPVSQEFIPEGWTENSPTFQGCVGWFEAVHVPKGRLKSRCHKHKGARFGSPFGIRRGFKRFYPTLKGWAILMHPFGMKNCAAQASLTTANPGNCARGRTHSAGFQHIRRPQTFNICLSSLILSALLLTLTGCQTARPLPAADLKQPGWKVQEGEAVWKRNRTAPELAGELMIASRSDGRVFVQFSKTPFPLVIAQKTTNTWEIQIPIQNRRFSGHGKAPKRVFWLFLPQLLDGQPPPKGWSWKRLPENRWNLSNPASGESVEGYVGE